ncbi:hypothetical protein N9B94_01725 [Verrucomicrobia bacterium]|nr:hypothetical protein [Verrucomicrobiota bacterium]
MPEEETECRKCKTPVLDTTAARTGGLCVLCNGELDVDQSDKERFEKRMRFGAGFVGAFFGGISGHVFGLQYGSGVAVFLAIGGAFFGFGSGFFLGKK